MPYAELIAAAGCLVGAVLALRDRNREAAIWAVVALMLVVIHAGRPPASSGVSPEPVTCRLWES